MDPNPYNFTGFLEQAIRDSSSRMDGLNADLQKLTRSRDDILMETSAERGAGFASMIAPFLGGYLGGGGGSQGLAYGGAGAMLGVTNYFNNLEADEKRKTLAIEQDITRANQRVMDENNFGQQLIGYGAQYQSGMDQAYSQGKLPGTLPFQQLIGADIDKARQVAIAKEITKAQFDKADPTKTLDADMAQNMNVALKRAGGGYAPLKPGTPASQVNTLSGLISAGTGAQSYGMRADKLQQDLAQAQTASFMYKNPQIPSTPEQNAKLTAKIKAFEAFSDMIPAINEVLKVGSQLSAAQAEGLRPIFSRWVAIGRDLDQTGANLTVPEIKNTFAALPQVLENANVSSWGKILGDSLRGVDGSITLDKYLFTLKNEIANEGKVIGFYHPMFKEFYGPEDYARFGFPADLSPLQRFVPIQPGAQGQYQPHTDSGMPASEQPQSAKLGNILTLLQKAASR